MKIRHLHAIVGITISLISSLPLHPQAPTVTAPSTTPNQASQMPFPEITEEDLKKAEEEIEAFRTSLPEEERKKFDQDVQEFTKALETMSEKELEEFFNQLMTLDENAMPKMPEEPRPVPVPTEALPQPEPVKVVPVKKGDTRPAEQLIDDIVKYINNFTVKMGAITDIDQKFKTWHKKGKLITDESITEWGQFTHLAEQLKQQLLKLKDKDPKTREFRYLHDLIDNKKLYEELSILKGELATYEQNIILPSTPGAHQISANNRTFIIKMIDTLIRALRTQKIDEQIHAIFAKYEPVAKALKETEEQREKRALEAGRRPPQPEPAKTYGRAPTPPTPYQRPEFDNRMSSGGMASSYAPVSPTRPRETMETGPAGRGTEAPTPRETSIPSHLGATKPETMPIDKKKGQQELEPATSAPTEASMTVEMKRNVRTVERLVDEVVDHIEQHIFPALRSDMYQKLDTDLTQNSPTPATVKRVSQLGKDLDRLQELLMKIKAGIEKLPHNIGQEYQETFKTRLAIFGTDARNLYAVLGSSKNPSAYNDAIKFAYFADNSVNPATLAPEILAIKDQANLTTLRKKIDEIVATLQVLGAKKE